MSIVIVAEIASNSFMLLQPNIPPGSDPDDMGLRYPRRNGYDLNDIACTLIDEDLNPWQFFAKYYLVDGVPVIRPDMGCTVDKVIVDADGVDFITISGASSGADIQVNDVSVGTANGDDIELTFDLEGTYIVQIVLEPYLLYEVTINAS